MNRRRNHSNWRSGERHNTDLIKQARSWENSNVSPEGRLVKELADALEAAERLLREVNEKGLIYWEPQTERGHMAKADMMVRIDAWLARLATGQRQGDES